MKRFAAAVIVAGACSTALAGCSMEAGPPAPTSGNEPASQGSTLSGGAAGTGNHAGGGDARDAGHDPDPGAFGASCAAGSDCESDVCFLGGKGGFCSLSCSGDAACPPGADGTQHCNPHGYCRY